VKDFEARVAIRYGNGDFAIEAAGAPEGRVDAVGDIRCGDYNDLPAGLQAIHQGQELRHDPALDLFFSAHFFAFRRDGVNLIDEDDCRRMRLGILKDLPQRASDSP